MGGDQVTELARLRSENARLNGYVEQLQRDLGNARQHAALFSSFSYEETKALVEYGKSLQERRREDAKATCELVAIGRQRQRRNTVLGRIFRRMSDWFFVLYNRAT